MFNKLISLILVILGLFVGFGFVVYLTPWYVQELPLRIYGDKKVFKPGEIMIIEIKRKALICMEARVVKELVRIENGVEHEIAKMFRYTDIEIGEKTITVEYPLPDEKDRFTGRAGTYFWRGHFTYKPFGIIERRWYFVTEPFLIKLESNSEGG